MNTKIKLSLYIFFAFSFNLFGDVDQEKLSVVSAPEILNLEQPKLPADTLYPSDIVFVTLKLIISEEGKVKSSEILKGPGKPFDEAAIEASKKFTFKPAILSNGDKVGVEIEFRLKFKKPIIEKAPFVLNGTLVERGTRKTIVKASVIAKKDDRTLAKAMTNERGEFSLLVKSEDYILMALPNGYEKLQVEIKGKAGEIRDEKFYLEANEKGFQTTIRTDRVKSEVTKIVITKATVEIVPGTQGDALKVIQNLPGSARPSFGGGSPVLRGSSSEDSRVFLEGQEIPSLYHFGGLRSTFNSIFLESVEYIPGNFSSYYGRATGGVIDVKVRDLSTDLLRGKVDINFPYDASLSLETPVTKNLSIGVAFRRSYVDTFLTPILDAVMPEDSNFSFNTAPRFYDYQFLADYRFSKKNKFKLLLYGSLDNLKILFDNPTQDTEIRGEFSLRTMFHNSLLLHESQITKKLSQKSSLQFGYQQFKTKTGPELFFNLDVKKLSFRSTWKYDPLSWFGWRFGIDNQWDFVKIALDSPLRPTEGQSQSPFATQEKVQLDSESVQYQAAFFNIFSFQPIKGFFLEPSLRVDWYRQIKRWSFDPRFMMRYAFNTKSEIKAGVGLYHQPPTADQSSPEGGNKDLKPIRSLQASLGFSQEIASFGGFELTAFYKRLDDIVVRVDRSLSDKNFENTGVGDIYGFEFLLRANIQKRFSGWISYTFQRSFRKENEFSDIRPFDFDQPHILTTLGTYKFGNGWSSGFRFRLVSGNPTTPIEKSIYNTNVGTYDPVYGDKNSDRFDLFHQLDIRVDKQWTFNSWKLKAYLDIQNIYNQKNSEGYSYNYDYSKKQIISGLPILPIIGVVAEW